MYDVVCGYAYHPKKRTCYLLGDILFLQILKRIIGQDNKIEERMTRLFHLKKEMSHGFWRKKILIWQRKLYWEWKCLLFMGLLYDVASLHTKSWWGWDQIPYQPSKGTYNVQKRFLLFFYIFYRTRWNEINCLCLLFSVIIHCLCMDVWTTTFSMTYSMT